MQEMLRKHGEDLNTEEDIHCIRSMDRYWHGNIVIELLEANVANIVYALCNVVEMTIFLDLGLWHKDHP